MLESSPVSPMISLSTRQIVQIVYFRPLQQSSQLLILQNSRCLYCNPSRENGSKPVDLDSVNRKPCVGTVDRTAGEPLCLPAAGAFVRPMLAKQGVDRIMCHLLNLACVRRVGIPVYFAVKERPSYEDAG